MSTYAALARNNYLKDYYENNKISELERDQQREGMRNLWIAVLDQIATDIKIDSLICKGRYPREQTSEVVKWKRHAVSFVRKANKDFTVLCELSGYDPAIVWHAFQKVVKEHGQKK